MQINSTIFPGEKKYREKLKAQIPSSDLRKLIRVFARDGFAIPTQSERLSDKGKEENEEKKKP
jgi:hypothetical protein